MKSEILDSLKHLSDADLVLRVKTLASREREAMAQLVAHIAELDTRDVHLRAGHPSLFVYCRDELGLSEHEVYNRIEVARAARRFPVILEMLEEGSVTLTTVRLLAPHLTADNCRRVLDAARGKRKVEVEEIVARLSPRADAYQLLELLLEKRPNVLEKGEIYERLWPSTFVAEVNLSRLVFELREALDDDSRKPRWIRTVRGFGYAFAGAGDDEPPVEVPVPAERGWCRLILRDREVMLTEGENILGRSHLAEVFLDSTSVSRAHARIVVTGKQATLEDMGSKNGTFCRGRRLDAPFALADGDAIRVGTVPMAFRIVPPEVSTETGREEPDRETPG